MSATNKTTKKFGINLACKMAAEAIRDNIAPVSIVLSNLIVLQKADTFPKELTQDFFKRPATNAPHDVQVVRKIMEGMRSPNNGVADLLIKFMNDDWAFKKLPPPEPNRPANPTYAKKNNNFNTKNTQNVPRKPIVKTTTVVPNITIKKAT